MPTYEYLCTACANEWEEIQKISESPLDTCPKCAQKTAKRQISAGNFILKGGGWYADLYSSTGNKKAGDAKPESAAKSDAKDGASATKSESAAATPAKTEAPAATPAKAPSTTPSKT